ncbi:unnamed protein product [Lactuca virosa]|uniref:Transmembrane protein n=1 Tax=Lactuca virosa TaxID=75947 RepID=A0AAU9N0B1_9ASTR|nr:unnamed protein product [Lactuca virosa]
MEQNLKIVFLVMLLLSICGLFISSVLADKGSLMNFKKCGPSVGSCQISCRVGLPKCCNGFCLCLGCP